MPLKRPVKVAERSDKTDDVKNDQTNRMNPFAKPRKVSLLMREAYRSGAADGIPYYGARKSGIWFPQDDSKDGESVERPANNISKLMAIELFLPETRQSS